MGHHAVEKELGRSCLKPSHAGRATSSPLTRSLIAARVDMGEAPNWISGVEAKQSESVSALGYQPTVAIQPVLSGIAFRAAQRPHSLSRNFEQFTDCSGLHHCFPWRKLGSKR